MPNPSMLERSNEDRGAVFLSVGSKYACRMLSAVSSLRAFHPALPVTIMTNDESSPWLRSLADWFRCDVLKIPLAPVKRNCCYLTKTMLHRYSPYEQYIFLDADTLVAGKLDELWPRAEETVLVRWCNWTTAGKMTAGRCRQWIDVAPALVARALASPKPAINNGVAGFNRSSPMLDAWHSLASKRVKHMCDETSLMVLYESYPHRLIDDRWNRSGIYGTAKPEDTIVWHFHGTKHLRPSPGREPWIEQIRHCVAKNVAGCDSWLPDLLLTIEREAFAKTGVL